MAVIIVVGMPGSGKDALVQMAKSLGFGHVGMGDVVRHFAARLGIGPGDTSIGGFADAERKKYGPGIWAERTLDMMPPGNAVIDGSRSPEEIGLFRKRLGGNLTVVAVIASGETRFGRLRLRGREDDPLTFEDFMRRDSRELSWGLGRAMDDADVRVKNEGGLEDFKEECRAILERILGNDGKSI